MTTTVIAVGAAIPAMSHAKAMALAEVEAERLIDVVGQLSDSDWSRPTDCVGWDVKALLSHVLGAMEANARTGEFVGQYRAATKAAKRSGRPMIDEMTALQVQDHAPMSPAEITDRIRQIAPQALRGRRHIPAVMRAVPFNPGAPFEGRWKLGYLVDTIMNRDYWMHRVDLTQATGTELVLTADHDGRIVADVVAEWARTHRQPFTLTLDGPAGNTYSQGEHGEELQLDAVEFCRILSGRGDGPGLLNQKVPF
jgi:uncharacterized protein (TIGR03083 family)